MLTITLPCHTYIDYIQVNNNVLFPLCYKFTPQKSNYFHFAENTKV